MTDTGWLARLRSVHVFRLARDGRILDCNDAACEALGLSKSALQYQAFQQFLSDADGLQLTDELARVGSRAEPLPFQILGPVAAMPYTLHIWLEVSADEAVLLGELVGNHDQRLQRELMEVNQELAVLARERAKAAENERRARAAVETANRSRNNALATIVHELRQPLSSMTYALALIREGGDGPGRQLALDVLGRQITHLARMVSDLLDASRIQQGKLMLQREPVDLGRLAEDAINAFRAQADRARVMLELSCAATPVVASADPARLNQVLSNLLENALKFSTPGGRVDILLASGAAAAQVVVRDTGRGIAPDVLPHVFELFAQQRHGEAGGLGIGLAISHAIVKAHGGAIEARSAGAGQGAEFILSLPLEAPVAVAGVATP